MMVAGVIDGHAELRAQPASEPAPAGDDPVVIDDPDKPWSQGVPIEDRAAARELFREGNRLLRVPRPAKAVEKYAAALARWKNPAFYYNLALAQLSLDKEIEARESLERALQYGAEGLGEDELQEARKQLQDVTRQLGQIIVTCQLPGAEVSLDGVPLFIGPGSYRGWVKARDHELTAKKAGYLSEATRVTVSPAGLHEIDLNLITLTQATDASRRWAVWKPWMVVAAGGAIAAAGGGLHALSARSFTRYDTDFEKLDCAKGFPPPGCPADEPGLEGLNERRSSARRQQAIAVGSYVVGGSLIATGVVLLYLNRPRPPEQGASGPPARNLAVLPEIAGDRFGILVSVSH